MMTAKKFPSSGDDGTPETPVDGAPIVEDNVEQNLGVSGPAVEGGTDAKPGQTDPQDSDPHSPQPQGAQPRQTDSHSTREGEPNTGDPHEAQELKNDLLRLQAEYMNYRKRVERDRAAAGEAAVFDVLSALLPVLDDFEAARAHGDLETGPFAAIATKFEGVLLGFGLERIDQADAPFDPAVHEALSQQPSADVTDEQVTQVYRPGFRLVSAGENRVQVIRPAQVAVAVPQ